MPKPDCPECTGRGPGYCPVCKRMRAQEELDQLVPLADYSAAYYLLGLAGAWNEKGFPRWIDADAFETQVEVAKRLAFTTRYTFDESHALCTYVEEISVGLSPSPHADDDLTADQSPAFGNHQYDEE